MQNKLLVPDIGDFEKVEIIEILVKSGDLIIAKVVTNQEKSYKTSNKWHRKIENHFHNSLCKILSGDIVSTKKICATSIEKTKLFKETGALAIDMESFAMAEIALS